MHERVLVECTTESDVECECEDGFFRNETTKECQHCASCCKSDGNIDEHCRADNGEIETKCKLKDLQPSICLTLSTTAPATHFGAPVQAPYLLSSSPMIMPSFTHATRTPLLDFARTPIVSAPSETVQIKVTVASASFTSTSNFLGVSTTSINIGKSTDEGKTSHLMTALPWVVSVIIFIVCVIFGMCIKTCKSQRPVCGLRFISAVRELLAAKEKEGRKPSNHLSVSVPLLSQKSQANTASLPLTATNTAHKGTDSSNVSSGLSIYLPEQKGENTKLEKGIPSSLDNGPRSQGQQKGKCLFSKGDGKSEPGLEGQQPHCYTNNYEEESVTVAVDKISASYHSASQSASPSKNDNATWLTSDDCVISTSLSTFSSSASDQKSKFPPDHSGIVKAVFPGNIHTPDREISSHLVEPPLQSAGDDSGYLTHIKDVPPPIISDLCVLLDEERDIDGKDYKMFASCLGLKPVRIRYLKDQKQSGRSPSYILLTQVFSCMENSGTLKYLCSIFERMGRYDLIRVVDDWVCKNS